MVSSEAVAPCGKTEEAEEAETDEDEAAVGDGEGMEPGTKGAKAGAVLGAEDFKEDAGEEENDVLPSGLGLAKEEADSGGRREGTIPAD